jgi:hypothetical protein
VTMVRMSHSLPTFDVVAERLRAGPVPWSAGHSIT